jgi:hypothetical protein
MWDDGFLVSIAYPVALIKGVWGMYTWAGFHVRMEPEHRIVVWHEPGKGLCRTVGVDR